jgi:hypothetical protein
VPFLHALHIVTLVFSPIGPLLVAVAVLLIVEPLARVGGAILMEVYTLAFRFVVDPLALIDISTGLDESAHSVGHVALPVALVEGAIFPDLPSDPVALAILPLTVVNHPILKLCGGFGFVGEGFGEVELSEFEIGVLDWFWTYFG